MNKQNEIGVEIINHNYEFDPELCISRGHTSIYLNMFEVDKLREFLDGHWGKTLTMFFRKNPGCK